MRRTWIERAGAAVLLSLLLAGAAPGQSSAQTQSSTPPAEAPPAKPSRLEEMLAQALRTNPDVRVAAAKVSEAEAELNRVQLQVVQKVVQAYQAVEAAQAMAEYRTKDYQRVKRLAEQGSASEGALSEKEKQLAAAKTALAAAEADLSYLLGKQPAGTATRRAAAQTVTQAALEALADPDGTVRQWMYIPNVRRGAAADGPATDKIHKALERSISVHLKDAPVKKLVETLIEAVPEVHIQVPSLSALSNTKASVHWDSISVAAVLQLIEDLLPGYRFVVRDYGLLLANEGQIPPSAPLMDDFRKGAAAAAAGKNPPAEGVEGLIKQVDPASGLVTITIGSDAGLAKGHTLEVFRLSPTAKYLGTIRIIEVTATRAVGRPQGAMTDALQVGDRVASRVLGK
jgi:hypothetical protein